MSAAKVTFIEARELLDTAQRKGDIFGQTARGINHWVDRYADYRTAWHHGILHHLENWAEENEESITPGLLRGPEMATAIGEFVEGMLDLN
jgi:hypothetical protein